MSTRIKSSFTVELRRHDNDELIFSYPVEEQLIEEADDYEQETRKGLLLGKAIEVAIEQKIDLSYLDLKKQEVHESTVDNQDMSTWDLTSTTFDGVDFTNVKLLGRPKNTHRHLTLNLTSCTFENSVISSAWLKQALIEHNDERSNVRGMTNVRIDEVETINKRPVFHEWDQNRLNIMITEHHIWDLKTPLTPDTYAHYTRREFMANNPLKLSGRQLQLVTDYMFAYQQPV